MSETASLRLALDERDMPHSDIGARDTMWTNDGVGWSVHEGYDGALWLRSSGPMGVEEILRVAAGGDR